MGLGSSLFRAGLLGRLSAGRPRRAALVLVVAFLIPAVVSVGIWFVGLASVFDDVRWIPITAVIVVSGGGYLWLMLNFGFWGVGVHSGRDGGDQFEADFSPRTAFALGWLRWFMQVVGIGLSTLIVVAVVANMRWFHLFSHPAIDSLPDRMDSMPIPDDWDLARSDTGDDGSNSLPNGHLTRYYDLPEGYTFDDMKAWMSSPHWASDPDGDSFGELYALRCDDDQRDCRADLTPAPGGEAEFFVFASFRGGPSPSLRLRLTYEKYTAPDWDISSETIERASLMPVPDDWIEFDSRDSKTNNGEDFIRRFLVPDGFGPEDLEEWVSDDVWTAPVDGEAFGEIRLTDSCRTLDSGTFLCSAIVVATERDGPFDENAGPVESFRAALDADGGTVRVTFSRNG